MGNITLFLLTAFPIGFIIAYIQEKMRKRELEAIDGLLKSKEGKNG